LALSVTHQPGKATMGLLDGEVEITIRIAQKLVEVIGGSTAFWMTREAQYRRDLARLRPASNEKAETDWLTTMNNTSIVRFISVARNIM
jgi:plasmid maintenance system antidote protein VapI